MKKIIRKILGPKYEDGKWKLRSNRDIYTKTEKITDTMRRRRVTFYGHIKRKNEGRLMKRIFNYFYRSPKTQITWIKEVQKDMEEMEINEEDVKRREEFRKKIKGFGCFQEKEKRRLEQNGQKKEKKSMKEYWKKKKNGVK